MSHVTGIFTQLWEGDSAIDVPNASFGGKCPPVSRGIYAPAKAPNFHLLFREGG